MDYSNLAQPWQQGPLNSPRLPLKGNSSYFIKHHPKNWELVAFVQPKKGKTPEETNYLWLPILHTHFETAGCQGTRGTGQNVDSSLAKVKCTNDGYTILDPSIHDYIRVYPSSDGKLYHSDKFTKIENLGGEIVTTYNNNEYNEFRRDLVIKGHISLPHEQILKKIIHNHSRMIAAKTKFQHIPENKTKLDSLYDINRNMVKAMDLVKKDGINAYEL